MSLTDILKHPLIYQAYQNIGGFHQGRVRAIRDYLSIKEGDRIVDIGCGPGFIVNDLPHNIEYLGFDTDARYISYANAKFGRKARFFSRAFDDAAAAEYGPIDIVMMNGVLHHLSDDEVRHTLPAIRRALVGGGRLFTIDGCFVDGQSSVARFLLDHDRGQHIRTRDHYEALAAKEFRNLETHIEDKLSRFPYTFLVMIGRVES